MRDDARLCRRATRVVNDQTTISRPELAQLSLQTIAWTISSDYANHCAACAERDEIREHVCGAAEVHRLSPHIDDRHRRLGRNTRNVAPNKLIKHHVAQHEDVAVLEGF